jgi:restriction endonuclease Mrr
MGSRKIVDGTGEGRFSPDRDITRAEFAAIIVRGLGLELEVGGTPFSDVKASDRFGSVIHTAYKYHLIEGLADGTFRPNDKITREQAMVMIAKAMTITNLKAKLSDQSSESTLRPYADAADSSAWAKDSIAVSVQAGIVSGRSHMKIAPREYVTRAEVAVIVERLLRKSELI